MPFLRVSLLILLCSFAALGKSAAASGVDYSAPHEKAEAFFNTIIQGDSAKAFDTLLAGSSINASKPEASYNLRRQLQSS